MDTTKSLPGDSGNHRSLLPGWICGSRRSVDLVFYLRSGRKEEPRYRSTCVRLMQISDRRAVARLL